MLFRSCFWCAVAAAAGALSSGCHAPRAQSTAVPPSPIVPAQKAVSKSQPRISDVEIAKAHAHYAGGVIHDLNNEPQLALEDFYQAARKDPADETLILEVTRRLLQARQPERALELLTHAVARPDASGLIFARLGLVCFQLGKNDAAIEANRTAIKKSPDSLSGHQNLFLIYLQNKQPQEALKILDDAAKVPDAGAEFLTGLGELYTSFGIQTPGQKEAAKARALAIFQHAEKLTPANPQLRLRLADGFNVAGNAEKAAQIYSDLLKRFAGMPLLEEAVREKLADVYLRSDDPKRAVGQLEAIIRDNPTDAQAYYFLGRIEFKGTNYAQAVEHFNKAILLSPDSERADYVGQAFYELAAAQMNLNKDDEALVTLEKARQKFPQSFPLEYLMGMLESRRKNDAKAVRHYIAAEVIAKTTEPQRLDYLFYFRFGAGCERAGDYAQAEKNFQKCLELYPDFDEAQNYLGFMWADRGEKLPQARELIEKALKAQPKNAAYLDSMGWVLFRLNQPKEALDCILKAIQFSEQEDAEVCNHLGDIYSALGQPEKAREAWRKSVSIEPNEQVQKKLNPAVPE